ncbi:McrB family protein [Pseudochrobactrum sp. XF203]|uniref:McrB family protein n=1 Tax=Pseudochrobactrum sp. XF203 TaxID=2879116 RepID=UPI001CE30B95|nr:AAA family ATPase [Pseudochrobactrum sp. XF203]UCA46996.1 AAA family ATPase [Pseudochrobactrum sp. XF203]
MPINFFDLDAIRPDITLSDENLTDFKIPQIIKNKLETKLGEDYKFNDYTFSKKIKGNNTALFPSQYVNYARIYKPYAESLYTYIKLYEKIRNDIIKEANETNQNIDELYEIISNNNSLSSHFANDKDILLFSNLFSGKNNSITKSAFNIKSGKLIARSTEDVFSSGVLSAINTPNNNAQYFGVFIFDICEAGDLYEFISDEIHYSSNTSPASVRGKNILYYGAPGTGKSYQIDQNTKDQETVRTVFHPDTQNSDFVGTLKPANDNGTLSYRFSPGPFAKALAKAKLNPDKHIYLIIEELNRAPAAAVFGEIFLLLDRKSDGSSSYEIDFPSEEFQNWYKEKTGDNAEKFGLPENLSIYATMNSADQGVFPLDTAFRRRWLSEYIAITPSKAPNGIIKIQREGGEKYYKWSNFLAHLNDYLIKQLKIDEDRLIGHRFMSDYELKKEKLSGKLLIYLWDDLLRHHKRDVLFNSAYQTYGSLHEANEYTQQIFSKDFLDELGPELQTTSSDSDEENALEISNS